MSTSCTGPMVQFGIEALSVSYKARSMRYSPWDVVSLLTATMRYVPSDPDANAMVQAFSSTVRKDPKGAGEALSQAIYGWIDKLPEDVRWKIEQSEERRTPKGGVTKRSKRKPVSKDSSARETFAWQNRADLQ